MGGLRLNLQIKFFLHMLGEKISTGGPLHTSIYCSVRFDPHALHGKDQPAIINERSL